MFPPRSPRRGAKPLMSKPPAAVAPTSSGGVNPAADFRTARLQKPADYYARQMETQQMTEPRNWSGGVDPAIQDSGQMMDKGEMAKPLIQSTADEARNALVEMGRTGGVTAGPAVTGPNGGIPGLPGYDPNARVIAVGGNEPAPQDPTMRVRNRITRAAGERPLMGRPFLR